MATTLIAKETSKTSTHTYYVLTLNSISRNGTKLTANMTITLTMGSGTTVGSNWDRTLYMYTESGTRIYSKVLKSGSTSWTAGKTYTFTFSVTYDTGVYTDFSGKFYLRILGGSGTSGIWDGTSDVSGGSVNQKFTLAINASNIVHVFVNNAWHNAVPYVFVNNAWHTAQVNIYKDGWHIGG